LFGISDDDDDHDDDDGRTMTHIPCFDHSTYGYISQLVEDVKTMGIPFN
jgi:hypothetical protein